MEGQNRNSRFLILMILIGLLMLTCVVRLFDLQIVHGEKYRQQAEQRLVRAYPVKAPRGEILDRNEKPFVQNRMGYVVLLQKLDMEDDLLNEEIILVTDLVEASGGALETEFPIVYDKTRDRWDFVYSEGKEDSLPGEESAEEDVDGKAAENLKREREEKLAAWKKENKLENYETAKQIYEYYRGRYAVAGKYRDEEALDIVAVRYDMEKRGFSANNPYVIARDVDERVVQQLKEQSVEFPGIEVEIEPVRSFAAGKSAAHILGRTGKIYAEEYQELKEQGYGMNDVIGKDGLEKVLEPYLKGKDGYKSVSMARDGGETEILESQAVEPGHYAKLTLDLELQQAMEKALETNITAAVDRNGAGGAIAIVPGTGEVLAMASYPGYDPATFDQDYEKLVKAKSKPLFNRVLNGTYSPGSTFKPLTAIAGLETGVIQPNTYIVDKGKYTYFDSYQPTCLIYSSTGATHGTIEVSEALGVSCNYFFYEVGRLVGIDELDEYAAKFGLGETTGIELAESKGQVAGPKLREAKGEVWYPGDVIQTAIGQSDSLFTPAQLANYIATLLNRGTRYRLHLVDEIVNYDTGEVVMKREPEVLEEVSLEESTFRKVTEGMRQVVTNGTARSAFLDADYQAAGKTGTAEVPDGADNVLFVGFAPYEKPEIVVAVVIEHGATSSYAANVAREVFDAYMKLKETRENPREAKKAEAEKKAEATEAEERENPPKSTGKTGLPTAVPDRGKTPEGTTVPDEKKEEEGIIL